MIRWGYFWFIRWRHQFLVRIIWLISQPKWAEVGCLGFLWEFLDRIYVTSQWKHSLAVTGIFSPAGRAKGKNGLQSCFQHSAVTRTIEHLCNRQSSLHVGSILAVIFLQFADISPQLTFHRSLHERVESWSLVEIKRKLVSSVWRFPALQRSTGVKISCDII